MSVRVLDGDALTVLRTLPDQSVQCCVTSPPYFGLRDYGVVGQLGLEKTPQLYVDAMVGVFSEVKRVLRNDGTLWLNIGDSYAARGNSGGNGGITNIQASSIREKGWRGPPKGMKDKDLIGVPWMLAFALRADGWYLRSDIIWSKPNPMPEPVVDRPTKAHEYVFLLSKSRKYFYDADAIREPLQPSSVERLSQSSLPEQLGSDRVPGKTNGPMKAVPPRRSGNKQRKFRVDHGGNPELSNAHQGFGVPWEDDGTGRNRRSVWTVATQPFSEAHFATFPPKLIEPCILAGTARGDTVLDPFGGAGTTGLVADRLGRDALLIELNPEYAAMARNRIHSDNPLFGDVA